MTKEAEYDVFISYSRSDYVYDKVANNNPDPDSPISKLMEFLDKNDIKCWLDTKGIYLGDSFPKELKDAINNSKMLVFASSKSSNASKWTPREIGYADKRDKKILPFRIDDSPYGEDIEIYFPITQHCNYYSDPEVAFESLFEGIKKAKEEYQRKRKEEEKTERVLIAKKELEKQVKEYEGLISRIKPVADRIAELEITSGNTARTCPVCGDSVPMKDYFCGTCGWTFVPPFKFGTDIDGLHLNKAKDIWNSSRNSATMIREPGLKIREEENIPPPVFAGHGYMDLGLPSGLLWATCNVGAKNNRPNDYGEYFAWGETNPKDNYIWKGLKYCDDKTGDTFSKYNLNQKGNRDGETLLDDSDDAASANWGGIWRIPTVDEWKELKEECAWTWENWNGHFGYKVARNGKSIFLPASGYKEGIDNLHKIGAEGRYWSSSLYQDNSGDAFGCFFSPHIVGPSGWYNRCRGYSVRPVASPFTI